VNSSFKGIKPAVIGLLAAVAISLGNSSLVDPKTFGIAIMGFAVIAFTKTDPTFVIIGAGIIGALILWRLRRQDVESGSVCRPLAMLKKVLL
jgi:chromate transporter